MYTIALRLDPDTRSRLELLARVTGRTRPSLVAEAVTRFVDAELARLASEAEKEHKERAEQAGSAGDANERWNIIV